MGELGCLVDNCFWLGCCMHSVMSGCLNHWEISSCSWWLDNKGSQGFSLYVNKKLSLWPECIIHVEPDHRGKPDSSMISKLLMVPMELSISGSIIKSKAYPPIRQISSACSVSLTAASPWASANHSVSSAGDGEYSQAHLSPSVEGYVSRDYCSAIQNSSYG